MLFEKERFGGHIPNHSMRRSKEWPAKWTVLIDGVVGHISEDH